MNEKTNEFDAKARSWDADGARAAMSRAVADAIREEIRLSGARTAFEYGCGTGIVGLNLQGSLARMVMADSSKGMLEVLRGKIAGAHAANMFAVELDLMQTPPPEEKFDLVYTVMTLHHVHDTDRLLGIFHSMLAEGGRLCIADLDAEDGSFHGEGFDGHRGFDRADLGRRAAGAGFVNTKFRTAFELARVVGGDARRVFPLFLMTAEKA